MLPKSAETIIISGKYHLFKNIKKHTFYDIFRKNVNKPQEIPGFVTEYGLPPSGPELPRPHFETTARQTAEGEAVREAAGEPVSRPLKWLLVNIVFFCAAGVLGHSDL